MKVAVRYYSRSGNTKKIAEAIGNSFSLSAKSVSEPITEPVDILFLGGALYAGNIDKNLASFAEKLTKEKVRKVVVFSTAAGPNSAYGRLKDILSPKGIDLSNEVFQCRGKFLLAHKNRPNEQDLTDAKVFAKKIIEE